MLKLKVAKKPDKMHMDLLSDDSDPNSGIWSSITRYNIQKISPSFLSTNTHLHAFSYEIIEVIFCKVCLFIDVHCFISIYGIGFGDE